MTVCTEGGRYCAVYICAGCIIDSINHSHVLHSEQWQSSKSRDEKLLPQLSRDGKQKPADFNLPETKDFETRVDQFKIQETALGLLFCFFTTPAFFLKCTNTQKWVFQLQEMTCGINTTTRELLQTLLTVSNSRKVEGIHSMLCLSLDCPSYDVC